MIFVKLCAAPVGRARLPIQRLSGGDRYATATAISRSRFATASTVFVATGDSFPDALAGSPAAAKAKGPILLTAPTRLPSATATELARLKPGKIVILGRHGRRQRGRRRHARDPMRRTVVRWAGADRYATAANHQRVELRARRGRRRTSRPARPSPTRCRGAPSPARTAARSSSSNRAPSPLPPRPSSPACDRRRS